MRETGGKEKEKDTLRVGGGKGKNLRFWTGRESLRRKDEEPGKVT